MNLTQDPLTNCPIALAQRLVGHSNVNCASDLGVAGHNLLACAEGAFLNVEINLPGIGDEAVSAPLGAQANETLAACRKLAEALR